MVKIEAVGPRRSAFESEDSGVDNCNVADAEGLEKRAITNLPDVFP
jgi:hypothetical protein